MCFCLLLFLYRIGSSPVCEFTLWVEGKIDKNEEEKVTTYLRDSPREYRLFLLGAIWVDKMAAHPSPVQKCHTLVASIT